MKRYLEKIFLLINSDRAIKSLLDESNITLIPCKDEGNGVKCLLLLINGDVRHRLYYAHEVLNKLFVEGDKSLSSEEILNQIGFNEVELINAPTETIHILENHYLGKTSKFISINEQMILSSDLNRMVSLLKQRPQCLVCGKPAKILNKDNMTFSMFCDDLSCSLKYIDKFEEQNNIRRDD